ncbi:hypothetical protein GCM10010324_26410 [Streptomyces hiroshimensis]|uniref:Uncharacterized protein n=1 Tax=Streptomyces hiroshimensis TaxID=66424 RepID=A0ABQ2YEB4_9ACTN|nr:hypothetical protein GCM10010324_26410 [Streptomyces hiroshimensis]
MGASLQTGDEAGAHVSRTAREGPSEGPECDVPAVLRHKLFDARPRTTYTQPSLALTGRNPAPHTPCARSDAVRWGNHKGS